jgi:uncharacterized protein involved in exopolysaccharide biosynthesis
MDGLLARRDSISTALRIREAELEPLPQIERELKRLELIEKVALNATEVVEREYREAEIRAAYAPQDAFLAAAAIAPQVPSGPSHLIFGLVSFLGALMVGICIAFLLEYLNWRVRSIRDVEDLIGVKVIGTIPRLSHTPALGTELIPQTRTRST